MTWTAPNDAAFISVDPQIDFCPGGNLAVNGGDEIMPLLNNLKSRFRVSVVTQDFHPTGHKSFASTHGGQIFTMTKMPYGDQMLWPDHCVQGTPGVEFHRDFIAAVHDLILTKGTNPDVDSYSAFLENDKTSSPVFSDGKTLAEKLESLGVKTVVLGGLAYDYCVGYSALDARAATQGLNVIIVKDATRAIADASEQAMTAQLQAAGVKIVDAADLPRVLNLVP